MKKNYLLNQTFKYFLIVFLAISCSKGKSVEFVKMDKMQFKKINSEGNLVLKTNATLHNGYSMGVEIAGVDFQVFLDGKHVSDVTQTESVRMKPSADFTLPLEAELSAKQLFGSVGTLLGALSKKDKQLTIEMKGKIKVKVLGRELGVPFNYEEKRSTKDFF